MLRHRQIAASPERAASETWDIIAQLVLVTLERSPSILAAEVIAAMDAAAPVGRLLIAGGHLDHHPLILVADPVYLSISTVSGTGAARAAADENLDPVPGGASAETWSIHLPTPEPLSHLVKEAASKSEHLTIEPALKQAGSEAKIAGNQQLVDVDAVARRREDR